MMSLEPSPLWLLMTTILLFDYFFTHSLNDVCTGIEMFEELFLSLRSGGGCEWLWQRLLKCMTLHGKDQNTHILCIIRATGAILVKTCALGHYGI